MNNLELFEKVAAYAGQKFLTMPEEQTVLRAKSLAESAFIEQGKLTAATSPNLHFTIAWSLVQEDLQNNPAPILRDAV